MKKMILLLLASWLSIPGLSFANETTATFKVGNGTYNINGKTKQDAAPYIKNGRTYLPLRFASYAVGIGDNSIYWDQASKTAFLSKDQKLISIRLGAQSIQVGDRIILTDAPAEISQGRTMLPLRVIAEALGCEVIWDADRRQVTIIQK